MWLSDHFILRQAIELVLLKASRPRLWARSWRCFPTATWHKSCWRIRRTRLGNSYKNTGLFIEIFIWSWRTCKGKFFRNPIFIYSNVCFLFETPSNPWKKSEFGPAQKERFNIYYIKSPRGQCCGSMPLTNGSGSCYFHHWSSRGQQKTNFFKILKKFFCLLLFEGTFTTFFNDKKSKRSQKTVGFMVFLTIFAWR